MADECVYSLPKAADRDISGPGSGGRYWYRATYGRYHTIDLSLDAGENGEIPLHGPVHIDRSFCTVSLQLPKEAYRSGRLVLRLSVQDGQRGPNVSEIMITKRRLTENAQIEIESC